MHYNWWQYAQFLIFSSHLIESKRPSSTENNDKVPCWKNMSVNDVSVYIYCQLVCQTRQNSPNYVVSYSCCERHLKCSESFAQSRNNLKKHLFWKYETIWANKRSHSGLINIIMQNNLTNTWKLLYLDWTETW